MSILKVMAPWERIWGVSVWVVRQPLWDDCYQSEPAALFGHLRNLIWDGETRQSPNR